MICKNVETRELARLIVAVRSASLK